jgi:hypothetical protein
MRLTILAAATAAVLAVPLAAHAATPTTRTITDTTDDAAAYDIVQVTLRSPTKPNRPAVVIVRYDRTVALGDSVEAWFDLDNDKVPDVHVSGSSFSEYSVRLTSSFDHDGRDISNDDCVRLSMQGRTSKFRLFPDCLGDPDSLRVSVKSSADADDGADDWAPGTERFSKKVPAAAAG